MGGEVYGDLLFLVNFSMDFLCGYLSARLLHRRIVPWRFCFAAALGGVYAVAALFLPRSGGGALMRDLGVCLLMCVLFFGARGVPLRFFTAACGVFVGVSMAMGGMMTALFQLLNRLLPTLPERAGEEDGPSVWLFAVLAGASALAGLWGGRLLRRSAARRFARLTVSVEGRSVEVQALLDSGNLCRDPISGKAVIFLAPARMRLLVGEGDPRADALARRFRLVPVETVGGRRLQRAYLPDRVTLRDAEGAREIDALIAPAETLAGAGVYEAIVPTEAGER